MASASSLFVETKQNERTSYSAVDRPRRPPASVVDTVRRGGEPLESTVRTDLERRFGWDFSLVRVHIDAGAAASACEVRAPAYTVGSHVVFRAGAYAPHTPAGRRLLAHELAHVVQQSRGRTSVSDPTGYFVEADAERAAAATSAGEPVRIEASSEVRMACQSDDSRYTQTEWQFPTNKYSLFDMVRTIDTGNTALNFALNKVLLPWRNLVAAIENMPIEMTGELDEAMLRSRFRNEWQAFQVMAPMARAMGIAVEIGPVLSYLRVLARGRRAAKVVEAAATESKAVSEPVTKPAIIKAAEPVSKPPTGVEAAPTPTEAKAPGAAATESKAVSEPVTKPATMKAAEPVSKPPTGVEAATTPTESKAPEGITPKPSSASPAPVPPGSTSTIWGQGSSIQGRGGEAYIGATQPGTHFFGTFRQFDGAVYAPGGPTAPALEVSQTKTIDTARKTYQGSGLRTLIERVAGELGGVGESQWEGSGFTVTIGPHTQRVLNVVLPQTALTALQESELAAAVAGARTMGVLVRIFRVP